MRQHLESPSISRNQFWQFVPFLRALSSLKGKSSGDTLGTEFENKEEVDSEETV
jgi:hypothetical protein